MLLNGGPHRFALRLIEPQRARRPARRLIDARAEVELPEGEDARPRRVLRQRDAARDALPAALRAVAAGAARSRRTDLGARRRLPGRRRRRRGRAGPRGPTELRRAVDVDFVELYATVVDRRGRPVEDLTAAEVRRCSRTASSRRSAASSGSHDLPIHAGVMLDTSASMVEELDRGRARRAPLLPRGADAARPRGGHHLRRRAAAGRALHRPASSVLAGGARRPRGRRARPALRRARLRPPLLHAACAASARSCCSPTASTPAAGSRFDEVLEYARRTGVAIYAIGLNVPSNPLDGRHARSTSWRARPAGAPSASSAPASSRRVYATIERELRAQYLIAYQSLATIAAGESFRAVERRGHARRGVEARARCAATTRERDLEPRAAASRPRLGLAAPPRAARRRSALEFEVRPPTPTRRRAPGERPRRLVRAPGARQGARRRPSGRDRARRRHHRGARRRDPRQARRRRRRARAMLARLSGRDHEVWTGVALVERRPRRGARRRALASSARRCVFRALDRRGDRRLRRERRADRQGRRLRHPGLGGAVRRGIDGNYTNVVGLPLGLWRPARASSASTCGFGELAAAVSRRT